MSIRATLQQVEDRIALACASARRPVQSVTLLAVSKTFPAPRVREAFDAGQRRFGENYVQEAIAKMDALAELDVEWHLIGPLQSNKTRAAAERFAWVHSIDRLKIAERLAGQRPPDLPPLNVCIEVNVSGETSKSGVTTDALPALAHAVAALPRLKLRGLMAVPEPVSGFEAQRAPYRRLRELFETLQRDGLDLDTLSIGMSADLEAAIAEGATIVRIGSAIFGARPAKAG
jgi:pyridoxal phosphate enzyme (YggS family)